MSLDLGADTLKETSIINFNNAQELKSIVKKSGIGMIPQEVILEQVLSIML